MTHTKGSKRSTVPRRPYESERLISEGKLLGVYGLRNKRELYTFAKIANDLKKKASSILITNNETKFTVEGRALLNKLQVLGIVNDEIKFDVKEDIIANLENVPNLTTEDFLKRRLQYRVFELGLANSVHQARAYIKNKYIEINDNVVDKPSYLVRRENDGYIQLSDKYNKMISKSKKNEVEVVEEEN